MRSLSDMKKHRFPAVLFCGPFISSELHDDVQQDIGAGVPLVRGVVHMAVNLPVLQDVLEIVGGEKLCDGPVKLNIQRILQQEADDIQLHPVRKLRHNEQKRNPLQISRPSAICSSVPAICVRCSSGWIS